MISHEITSDNQIRINQRENSPSVYLDHWAMRKISVDSVLRSKFVNHLKKKNGTLVLSLLNLMEFTAVADRSNGQAAEIMIDSIIPNLFFIEINPFEVIQNENKILSGAALSPPHGDSKIFKAFTQLQPTSTKLFSANDLFTSFQESDLKVNFEEVADSIVEQIEIHRQEISKDKSLNKSIRKATEKPPTKYATNFIFRELARSLVINQKIKMTQNHAIDLLHSVVPVAYCDYVLLDKHWRTQVNQIKSRIQKTNSVIHLADILSLNTNNIYEMLDLIV